MNRRINRLKATLYNMAKVAEVNKNYYVLNNGDVYEHTFEIDENITVDEFQKLLDNAKETILSTLHKIDTKD